MYFYPSVCFLCLTRFFTVIVVSSPQLQISVLNFLFFWGGGGGGRGCSFVAVLLISFVLLQCCFFPLFCFF